MVAVIFLFFDLPYILSPIRSDELISPLLLAFIGRLQRKGLYRIEVSKIELPDRRSCRL